MSKRNQFVQANAENAGVGNEVRTDDGKVGKIARMPKRGPVTVAFEDGTNEKHELTKLEVNTAKAVTMADIPADEKQPKATPVRERKATIDRVVAGRTYTYQNHGGGKIDNGDSVAVELRGKTLDEVYELSARRLGATVEELRTAYGSNNAGRQRMTLGNMLRAHAKAGEAGLTYVPPFKAAEQKAINKAVREQKAAEAKAAREAAAATKAAEKEANKAKAAEAARVKAEQKAATAAERQAAKEATIAKRKADQAAATPATV